MQPCVKFYQHPADRREGRHCSTCGWPKTSHRDAVIPCKVDPASGLCVEHYLPIADDGLCGAGRALIAEGKR
jgi:hypothetical protein